MQAQKGASNGHHLAGNEIDGLKGTGKLMASFTSHDPRLGSPETTQPDTNL
jgi:hypothetical protein